MTSSELYKKLTPTSEKYYECCNRARGLDVNLSDMFSKFVKDAARCSAYNSDIFYDMKTIESAMREFDPTVEFDPIWVGFRRYGVDCTSYVLCRAEAESTYGSLSHNYFALYSITVKERGDNYFDVVLSEYAM